MKTNIIKVVKIIANKYLDKHLKRVYPEPLLLVKNKLIAKELVKINPRLYLYLNLNFYNDKSVAICTIKKDPSLFQKISPYLENDPHILKHVPWELQE